MNNRLACFFLLVLGIAWAGCANISTPTGGKRDKTPPKLVAATPADSLLNVRTKRIELNFDEYITVADVQKEVSIMPILPVMPTVTGLNKHVVVKIVDSLLEPNTTYRISFGNAIKDLHEGNPFRGYTYTFSTGGYFDSLELKGNVINAATGLTDTSNVIVVLYDAKENDTAVVKKKPKYMARVNAAGEFVFNGLPARHFRIYAIKDANNNLIYDGDGEQVAFSDSMVMPGIDSTITPVTLRLFAEIPDTVKLAKAKTKSDTTGKKSIATSLSKAGRMGAAKEKVVDTNFSYTTNIDTTSVKKRTYDINKPIRLSFSRLPVINKEKMRLSYDSLGTALYPVYTIVNDTLHPNDILIKTAWLQNKVYKLTLDSAFAIDTGGKAMPAARYTFRTNNDDDYGKITLNLPSKYYGRKPDFGYVLMVKADDDTAYQQPVFDTVVHLTLLRPATYTFRIIADKNRNGKWDTGDLLGRQQPEEVIPTSVNVKLRTGFEHIIDFEEKAKPKPVEKKGATKDKIVPK